MLVESPALFARKFDESVDTEIFTALERHIRGADRVLVRRPTVNPVTLVAA